MISVFKILLPLIGGIITGIIKSSMEARQRQFEMLVAKAGIEEKSMRRAAAVKDTNVAWTRRLLAIMFSSALIGTLILIITAGLFNPDLVVNVQVETYKHSLFSILGFVSPKAVNGYVQLQGMTLVYPIMEALIVICESIVGFYFGSKR
jgi:hypothetical protein